MKIKTLCSAILIAAILLGSAQAVNAQSDSWRVTVFDRKARQLHYLTPTGIESGPVLPLADELGPGEARLSPDEHYLVVSNYGDAVWVADLVAGTCCVPLLSSNPDHFPTRISPISPDSTKIAVSMSQNIYFGDPYPIDLPIIVFDLASGQIVAELLLSQLQIVEHLPLAAQFGGWWADGLRVYPSSWGGEIWGEFEGIYQVWDPMAGTLSEPVEPFDLLMKQLPGTGEVLKAVADPAYPQSGFPSAYTAASNVVEYASNSFTQDSRIVYFNPNNVYVARVDWVAGGTAFLVTLGGEAHSTAENTLAISPDNEAALVFQDGHHVSVDMPGYEVLTGTPDGWIARSWLTGEVAIVQLLPGDQLNTITISDVNSIDWQLVHMNFQLGAGHVTYPLPAADPPPAFAACPGFMVSRLWPNTYALVLPGAAVDLRSAPSSSGTVLGTLPGDEMFAVISGPECAENTAWWQVEYKGTTGWLAEGQGNVYWLEPIGVR